jgi:hypothetical protein
MVTVAAQDRPGRNGTRMKTESSDWSLEKAKAPLRIAVEVEGRAALALRAIALLTGLPVEKVAERELASATVFSYKIENFFPHVVEDILGEPDPATVERLTEAIRAFRDAGHVQGFKDYELDLLSERTRGEIDEDIAGLLKKAAEIMLGERSP